MDQDEMIAQAKAADTMAGEFMRDMQHVPFNQKLTVIVAMFGKAIDRDDWSLEQKLHLTTVIKNALTISISLGAIK